MLRILSAILPLLSLLAHPPECFGYDQELQLTGELFYARFLDSNAEVDGGGAGAVVRYGLTDAIGLTGRVDWTLHRVSPTDSTLQGTRRQIITGAVGFQWAIDTFALVPFMGLDLGASVIFQDELVVPSFLLGLGGGLDVCLPRQLSLGLFFAYQFFFGEIEVPNRLLVSARVSWRSSSERSRAGSPPGADESSPDRSP